MSTVLELLLLGALLTLAGVTAAVLSVRWAVRRARRMLRARLSNALGALHSRRAGLPTSWTTVRPSQAHSAFAAGVRARACLPGPAQQVALVRRGLARDVAGTARAVQAGQQAGRPVQGLAGVVRRLYEPARALDVDLAVIAAEPDPDARQGLLAAQSERLELLRHTCAQVRHGVLLAGSPSAGPLLRTLTGELNDELVALGLRAQAHQELAAL